MGDSTRAFDPHDHGVQARHVQEFVDVIQQVRGGRWHAESRWTIHYRADRRGCLHPRSRRTTGVGRPIISALAHDRRCSSSGCFLDRSPPRRRRPPAPSMPPPTPCADRRRGRPHDVAAGASRVRAIDADGGPRIEGGDLDVGTRCVVGAGGSRTARPRGPPGRPPSRGRDRAGGGRGRAVAPAWCTVEVDTGRGGPARRMRIAVHAWQGYYEPAGSWERGPLAI